MMNRSILNPMQPLAKRPRLTTHGNDGALQVKVYVRVRPFNERESQCSCRRIISVVDKTSVIFDPEEEEEPFFFRGVPQKGRDITRRMNKNLHFQFDQIFDENATNEDVFEGSTKSIISSIFDGYNCSVFAYGATGAGKTYTMLGTPEHPGIAYLTIVELLNHIEKSPDIKVTLGVSYLEVYNENVKDLLHPSNAVLHLREDGSGGRITVSGLNIQQINHSDELFELLTEGNRNRTQHPTDSNEESSRSHAVFQVHTRIVSNGQVKISKLSMIDLAGSERASATGCIGARFKEGANINKSLLALEKTIEDSLRNDRIFCLNKRKFKLRNCINALADGLKHVPYRDSKLTRILKDSLGGNCRTVMIANISPSSSCFEDTYNTLKYATRTKCIKSVISKNVMNESLSIPQYKRMVQDLNERINKIQETGMPDLSEWENKIESVFEEKRKIIRELLSLQSQLILNTARVNSKEQAISHHDSTFTIQGSERLETAISQLKARLESIKDRIAECRPNFERNKENIQQLEKELDSRPKLPSILKKLFLKHKEAVQAEQFQVVLNHMQKTLKIVSMQVTSLNSAVNTSFPFLNECLSLLRAHGYLTKDLSSKYEEILKSLNGVKGITWCGDDDDEDDDNADLLQLKLDVIGDELPDFFSKTRTLTTTILLPSIKENISNLYIPAPLKLNNRLGNVLKSPAVKQSKWFLKSKSHQLNSRSPTPNKENHVKRVGPFTPITKVKPSTDTLRSNARAHPYRRTPLRQNTPNVKFKSLVK